MSETQSLIKFAPILYPEWKQAKDEGKDVEAFKDICKQISEQPDKEGNEEQAVQYYQKLLSAPVIPNYPYEEPSDLAAIKAAAPTRRHLHKMNLTPEQLKNKLSGAWIGRISGCLLGKPVEGYRRDRLYTLLKYTNNYPMHKYITADEITEELKEMNHMPATSCYADCINGIAPVDDDTNYTVFTMKLIETYGKDFQPNDVLEGWLNWIPLYATFTAEREAYRNAALGFHAPETALLFNPYREWIGAQIRGDFYGYINPGNPERAAEMAWRDASISHVKNGIYGEMFIAAMLSAAAVSDDIMTVIETGLDEIPEKSRLRRDVEQIIQWYKEGLPSLEVIEKIHLAYDENDGHGWCHTNSNAMIVTMALLYGHKDYGNSICLAVQAAFDTDCNGATTGSIIGLMIGEHAIPEYWYQCYSKKLSTSISGYNEVTIDQLVEKTLSLI